MKGPGDFQYIVRISKCANGKLIVRGGKTNAGHASMIRAVDSFPRKISGKGVMFGADNILPLRNMCILGFKVFSVLINGHS